MIISQLRIHLIILQDRCSHGACRVQQVGYYVLLQLLLLLI